MEYVQAAVRGSEVNEIFRIHANTHFSGRLHRQQFIVITNSQLYKDKHRGNHGYTMYIITYAARGHVDTCKH